MELKGLQALVTGASRGLGAAIARRLAAAGADLWLHYHRDEAGAAATAEAVRAAGREARILQADLSDPAAARNMLQPLDRLDLLVNNAGIAEPAPWDSITPDAWAETIAINLSGPFYLMSEALPLLSQAAGQAAVVNVGSVVSHNGGSFGPAYAAAKAGLLGLTRSAARDWGPLGIRVNAVAPGPLDSPLARSLPAPALEAMAAQTPLRRLGSFAEVADAICWLLSPAAAYINGQTLIIDGGRIMV